MRAETHPEVPSAGESFDGFPYLVTQLSPSFYHINLLPSDRSYQSLWNLTAAQFNCNRLSSCLVLAKDRCFYFGDGSNGSEVATVPTGGRLITGKLKLIEQLPSNDNLSSRNFGLKHCIEGRNCPDAWIFWRRNEGRATSDSRRVIDS